MKCIICGATLTPWPGGYGYGNNPDPWPSAEAARILIDRADDLYRCCDDCNATVVIPMRLGYRLTAGGVAVPADKPPVKGFRQH